MIQSDPTLAGDELNHPQPQSPPSAALTVVQSLFLAQQGGQNGQGGLGRAWDAGSGPREEGGGRGADDRGAMNSCG